MEADIKHRLHVVDWARGLALVAMTLFHFGWDLEMFGFVERGFASQPAMVWFARCIASSFLFLVGVSLVLAHGREFRRAGFLKRLAMVCGAAGLITVATWFATPDIFIFFGILHHIAVASVLGLLFLHLPAWINLAAAMAVLAAHFFGTSAAFDAPWLWWTGLNQVTPRSSDYVPIVPFFAAVLVGMATAKAAVSHGWEAQLAGIKLEGMISRTMRFIGRNSLMYYLLHQPFMISILYMFHMLMR